MKEVRAIRKRVEKLFSEHTELEDEDALCCVCGGGDAEGRDNDIIICDKCDCAYHQRCHQPKVGTRGGFR
jgi:hypothetical protein